MNKTPKLRFKGFNECWESKPLSKYTEKITKKNKGFSVTNVISNSAKNGLISQRDFFDKDIANQNNIDGYYIIENGDFVYNPRKSLESPYGPVNRYNLEDAGVVSPLYLCFKTNEKVNGKFLENYFKSSKWYRFIYQNSDQGARHDRVSIKDLEFFKLNTQFPSIEEQEKIASFFSLIDDKISLQGEKVEALKEFKKGMMQKIFSRELRFKGFDEEWQNHLLGKCIILYDNLRKPVKEQERSSGKYAYYGATGIIDYIDDYIFEGEYLLLGEDGANIVTRNAPLVYKTSGKFWTNNHAHIFKPTSEFDIDFMKQCLEIINYVPYNTGTAQPKLNVESIKSIPFKAPTLEEQKKIAKLFVNIDLKLEKEQEKLDSLNEYKKGLLQQMFV